jgi:hypothetical protein
MLAGSSALSRWAVAELAPFLLLVRGRQLAFGRKKENQPAEQKGHTTDYHRNANRIHVESSKEYRSGSFEDRKGRNAPFFETSFTAHLGGWPSAAATRKST